MKNTYATNALIAIAILVPTITPEASANPALNTKIVPLNTTLIKGLSTYSGTNDLKKTTPAKKTPNLFICQSNKSTIFVPPDN